MPIHPNYDQDGIWLPKSNYFKWVMAQARRRHMVAEDPLAAGAKVAVCSKCFALFVVSDVRSWCPVCSGEPGFSFDLFLLIDTVNTLAESVRGNLGGSPAPATPARRQRRTASADSLAGGGQAEVSPPPPPATAEAEAAAPYAASEGAAEPAGDGDGVNLGSATPSATPEPAAQEA